MKKKRDPSWEVEISRIKRIGVEINEGGFKPPKIPNKLPGVIVADD